MPGARIAEITIGKPRSAEEDELQDPIEDDGDLAEEELPEHVGRDQHVIEHQERYGEHRRRAQDVHQIRQRREPPLRLVKMEQVINDPGIGNEARQEQEQRLFALHQARRLEADVEARDDRRRRHDQVMGYNERSARAYVQSEHPQIRAAGLIVPAFQYRALSRGATPARLPYAARRTASA